MQTGQTIPAPNYIEPRCEFRGVHQTVASDADICSFVRVCELEWDLFPCHNQIVVEIK